MEDSVVSRRNSTTETAYRVDGISCLDCAAKFEKQVAALPGVAEATLNPVSGVLRVAGSADLEAIRRLGREENYTITPLESSRSAERRRIDPEVVRGAVSGVLLVAALITEWLNGVPALLYALYAGAIVAGAWGNVRKAVYALSRLHFNMSVLMTVAVIGAMLIGEWTEGAVVAFLFSVSESLESWAIGRARRSIRELMEAAPQVARVRRNGEEHQVPVERVEVGEVMLVRPGERIGLDGRIVRGEAAIQEAAVTGEAIPVEKGVGADVYAGTLNTDGYLEVEVTRPAAETALAKIIRLVEEAQAERPPLQRFVDRFASVYTPIVLVLAAGVALIPPLVSGTEWHEWLYRGLALLVVACPCALVVSTPVAIVSAIGNAARRGVLVKSGAHLEQLGRLRAFAFDKTGTLTTGEPVVTDVIPLGPLDEHELLALAAAVESQSEHPLARAILRRAEERGVELPPVSAFRAFPGRGAEGLVEAVDGVRHVYVGSARFFSERCALEPAIEARIRALQEDGKTTVLVGTDREILGIVALADTVRPQSAGVLRQLKQQGIEKIVVLTGDQALTARAVADSLGVEYSAELLPSDKVAVVEALREAYGGVVMVGDGLNDAPALAAATVGVAMGGTGTDAALETSDIVLIGDDLSRLPFLVRLSRKTLRVIRQNIGLSLGLKLLAIAAVFPGWLTLWLAILADMGATLLVTLNGIRLLRLSGRETSDAEGVRPSRGIAHSHTHADHVPPPPAR